MPSKSLESNPSTNKSLASKSPTNTIKGFVFIDSNGNGIKDDNEMPVEGVRINLFRVDEVTLAKNSKKSKTTSLLQEKLIHYAFTDKNGEFRFPVKAGKYSVNLDINTLPEGMGVPEPDILIAINYTDTVGSNTANDNDKKDIVEFGVKNVALIEIRRDLPGKYYPGEDIVLNTTPRDDHGKVLAAKINYSCDNSEVELKSNIAKIKKIPSSHKEYTIRASCGKVCRDIPITLSQFCGDSICIIRQAYQNGIIDENTKIYLYLKSLHSKERMYPEYWSDLPIKCGASAIKEIQDYIREKNYDKKLAEEAKRFLISAIPPLDKSYVSPSGYFKIHYTTEGSNAVPTERGADIPEYIKLVGLAFDHVKKVTCDIRGFRNPILEKGKKTLDVYVYDLQGVYGLTIPTKHYPMTSTRQRRASCNICIDNNYSSSKGFQDKRDNCMKVTAAHEFFHAVQYAYNVDADSWWKETSATWNEDEIYNDINDYVRYLDKVFQSPEKSLDKSSYGGVIFAKYLSENYGGYSIIKSIWEIQGIAYDTSIKAINAAIKEKYPEKNLGIAFKEYAARNFNPSQYYKDGHLWDRPYIQNVFQSYPAVLQNGQLDHLASSYHLFKPHEYNQDMALKITVQGEPQIKWGFKVQQKQRNDNLCNTIEIPMKKTYNRAEIIIHGFGKIYKEICLIPANLENKIDGASYNYSANIL
ncbi:MAG: hypothetical protein HPY74_09595 [Firmicutes bacterium]|nr:hypothetical protein [Bacillota bacterium]